MSIPSPAAGFDSVALLAPPGAPTFELTALDQIGARTRPDGGWLWHGFLAPGNLTLLTSQWKTGKTTLASVLLARMGAGGTLAGLPVRPGRAVIVSEESPDHWSMRHARLRFGPHVQLMSRPFSGRPTAAAWSSLMDYLGDVRQKEGLDLVVIDPLAVFLPLRSENEAGSMLDALLPLRRLTGVGVSVLVMHHPKKGDTVAGQAARGSGALGGHVDIVLEMSWFGQAASDDRRRRLTAFSRHEETPRRLVIELTADGTDYVGLGDLSEPGREDGTDILLSVLAVAEGRLTRRAIQANWPAGRPAPSDVSLYRWLERAVAEGRVCQGGSGRRNDPFVYSLPEPDEPGAGN